MCRVESKPVLDDDKTRQLAEQRAPRHQCARRRPGVPLVQVRRTESSARVPGALNVDASRANASLQSVSPCHCDSPTARMARNAGHAGRAACWRSRFHRQSRHPVRCPASRFGRIRSGQASQAASLPRRADAPQCAPPVSKPCGITTAPVAALDPVTDQRMASRFASRLKLGVCKFSTLAVFLFMAARDRVRPVARSARSTRRRR